MRRWCCGLIALVLWTTQAGTVAQAQTLTVAAGASLRDALQAIAAEYQRQTGINLNFTFGGSGVLLAQIQQGAPVDVYIAAAQQPIDQARAQGLLTDDAARLVAGNQLVLITPSDSKLALSSFTELSDARVKRLAIGQPKTVPAGVYAMQVFDHLQLTDAVKDRLVHGGNVRQVLDYVVRGEVDAGVVYRSDMQAAADQVLAAAQADANWHQPIVYPAAIVRRSLRVEASRKFIDHLLTSAAQRVFAEHGFVPMIVLESPDTMLANKSPDRDAGTGTPPTNTIPVALP